MFPLKKVLAHIILVLFFSNYKQTQYTYLTNVIQVINADLSCNNMINMSNMIAYIVGWNILVFLTAVSTLLVQVLVKSLFDRGFLFLLSSSQMVESKGIKKLFALHS